MPKLTFCGHACVLIESSAGNVILDPFLTGNPLASHTLNQIPKLSAILVTHGHADHIGDAITLAKRDKAPVVATYELAVLCQSKGAEAIPMNIGGKVSLEWGQVRMVQAFHSSSWQDGHNFVYTGMPTGILATLEGKTAYHLGDTALFSDLELIGRRYSPIDVALIPMGDHFTMGIEDAVEAWSMIRPKQVVPIHYNTFPPITQDPGEFRKQVEARGGQATILPPGSSLEY